MKIKFLKNKAEKILKLFLFSAFVLLTLIFPETVHAEVCLENTNEKIVIVHGGWMGEWSWAKVVPELEEKGFEVEVVELPGHGVDTTPIQDITMQSYIDAVEDVIGDDNVILVGHAAFGGVVSQVAELMSDQIDALVYLAAVVPVDGESSADVLLSDIYSPAMAQANIDFINGIVELPDEAMEKYVYQMSPKEDVEYALKHARVELTVPLLTPIHLTESNYGSVDKYYIHTMNDLALSTKYQESLMQKTQFKETFNIDSDHCPFFSNRAELTRILTYIAKREMYAVNVSAINYTEEQCNHIMGSIFVKNSGEEAIPLKNLCITYYFNDTSDSGYNSYVDAESIIKLDGSYESLNTSFEVDVENTKVNGSNKMIIIKSRDNRKELMAGEEICLQYRVARKDYLAFDQTDDYSFLGYNIMKSSINNVEVRYRDMLINL